MGKGESSKGRQSFNRGIEILEMLAERGPMSASAIGRALEVNQSSATRLLQSLQQAGLVYKPSFQRFALDLGILRLAGVAMDGFPIVKSAANVCNELHAQYEYGFSVATVDKGHLLYLAHIEGQGNASVNIIDNSEFPLSKSSLGLCIAHSYGYDEFEMLMKSDGCSDKEVTALWQQCENSFAKHSYICLEDTTLNKVNAAQKFEYDGRTYAFAVFRENETIPGIELKEILKSGIEKIVD